MLKIVILSKVCFVYNQFKQLTEILKQDPALRCQCISASVIDLQQPQQQHHGCQYDYNTLTFYIRLTKDDFRNDHSYQ